MLCITDLYGLKLILIYMVNGQVSGKIWDKYSLSSTVQQNGTDLP